MNDDDDDSICTIDFDEQYLQICSAALAMTHMLLYDLKTDFSRHVYHANLVDLDEIEQLMERFEHLEPGEAEMDEPALVLLFSAHYIANCFTQDGASFFKWFIEEEKGEVDSSADFRYTIQNVQMGAMFAIRNSGYYQAAIDRRYQQLLQHFGPCLDDEGNESF